MIVQGFAGNLSTKEKEAAKDITFFTSIKVYILGPIIKAIQFILGKIAYFICLCVLTILAVVWSFFWRFVLPICIVTQTGLWAVNKFSGIG